MEETTEKRAKRNSAAVASARIHDLEGIQAALDEQLGHPLNSSQGSRKRKRSVSIDESPSDTMDADSSETESDLEQAEDDLDRISELVGHRLRKRSDGEESKKSSSRPYELEYLVKLKGESYRQCEWTAEEELQRNTRAKQTLRRYRSGFKDEGELLDCCSEDPLEDTLFCRIECVLHFDQIPLAEEDMADEDPCCICGKADDAPRTILCDSCDRPFHLYCLQPRLRKIPQGEWFCKDCRPDEKKAADSEEQKQTETSSNEDSAAAVKKEDVKQPAFEPGRTQRRFSQIHRDALEEISKLLPPLANGHAFTYFCKWTALRYVESTWEELDIEASEDDALAVLAFWKRESLMKKRAPKPILPSGRQFAPLLTQETIPLEQGLLLRGYQVEGVNWLMNHWELERGSLLADEMGLGKTLQILAFLATLVHCRKQLGPFLIIAPLSTLAQWKAEAEKWTDLRCLILHGQEKDRMMLKDFELLKQKWLKDSKFARDGTEKKWVTDAPGRHRFHILVTSFEMAAIEKSFLARIPFSVIVVDETQRLKNSESIVRSSLVSQPFYETAHKVALTGTPIQNNVEELFSILNFINPTKSDFVSKEQFLELYGDPKDAECVKNLQNLLRGYLLRRCKVDVEKDLPAKVETVVDVELTPMQKQYYRAILERNKKFLYRNLKAGDQPSLMNIFMQLRKLCNHPFLISGSRERVERGEYTPSKLEGPGNTDSVLQHPIVSCSGKVILLHKLLHKITSGGEKVLIFSQFVMMLDLLSEYLDLAGYDFVRLDGRIDGAARAANLEKFRNDSNTKVFLISTRAGGVGLNLQNASHVIIYDSDWNPQNDLQAQARTHRIGQKKEVRIYRLLTRKTYEQRLMRIASLKLGLDAAILGQLASHPDAIDASQLTPKERTKEIERLLREGSYELLTEDEKTAEETAKAFAESNIDTILESAREVVYKAVTASGGESLFAKATFVASNCDSTVELDDPEFWTKLLPDVSRIQQMIAALSIGLQRVRITLEKRAPVLAKKAANTGIDEQQKIRAQQSLALTSNLWDKHVKWWRHTELPRSAAAPQRVQPGSYFLDSKLDVRELEDAEAYPGAKELAGLMSKAVDAALSEGRGALDPDEDLDAPLSPEDLQYLSDKVRTKSTSVDAAGTDATGTPTGSSTDAKESTGAAGAAGTAEAAEAVEGNDPAKEYKVFLDKVLVEAEKAEAVRLAGDPYEELEGILNLLSLVGRCGFFDLISPRLTDMRLATRIPRIRANIEKPKRRRRTKVSYLGDDNPFEGYDSSDGSVSYPSSLPSGSSGFSAAPAPAALASKRGPNQKAVQNQKAGQNFASKEETLIWAERMRHYAQMERDRLEYERKVANVASKYSNAFTKVHGAATAVKTVASKVRMDEIEAGLNSLQAKNGPQQGTGLLQRMLFLPPCLHENTKKLVAPRRQRLVMYPPSDVMPFFAPYVIHVTWCSDPMELFEVQMLQGGWCTLTSKVEVSDHFGRIEGPFGFLAGDVLLSLNNCSVRKLTNSVMEVMNTKSRVKMRLVRFVYATHPMGWNDVELISVDGVAIPDVHEYAKQFPGVQRPITFADVQVTGGLNGDPVGDVVGGSLLK